MIILQKIMATTRNHFLKGFIKLFNNTFMMVVCSIFLATSFVNAENCMIEFTEQDFPEDALIDDSRKIRSYNFPLHNRISYKLKSEDWIINVDIKSYNDEKVAGITFDEDVQFFLSENSDWTQINEVVRGFSGFLGYALTRDNLPRYLLESMHGNCNIIRIVTDIGSDNPDQLIEMYRFWMAYEQAQSLLGLWISSGPVYVGVSEICYLGVAGGKKPYYVTNIPEHNIFMVNKKDDSNFGMTYDIGFFKIIGKNIGDTSLSVTDSSQPEQIVQVPVHVVESVSPSLSPV